MRAANPGDLVLSCANQLIRYVGRVADFALTAPKPSEFGATGAYWNNEGWLLPAFWTRLDSPIRLSMLLGRASASIFYGLLFEFRSQFGAIQRRLQVQSFLVLR